MIRGSRIVITVVMSVGRVLLCTVDGSRDAALLAL